MENERLVFKFYKSYFDTAKLLDDKNRLAFYDALLEKQFNFIEPTLSGLAELVYVSQKHNIDSQVNGWLEKIKSMGIAPPALPPIAPPALQLEKKYKEEEEEIKEKKKPIKKAVALDFSFVANNFSECFMKWIEYKRELKQAYKSQTSLQQCYNNLLKLSAGNPTKAMHVVNQSIGNGWAGLFEFKGQIEPEDKTDKFFANGQWHKKTPLQKYH